MKYRLTILNITAFLFIIGCILYSAINYPTLAGGEGWGIVYMAGLTGFGLTALVVDWLFILPKKLLGKKWTLSNDDNLLKFL